MPFCFYFLKIFTTKTLLRAFTFVFLILFFLFNNAWAETRDSKCLKGIEFFTGFTQAKLNEKGYYRTVPLLIDFDFNLKPLAKKIGLKPSGLLQFQLEPFISSVYQPDNNIEIGNSFLFKVGLFPGTWKLQPYLKVGIGIVYMTQHTSEQSTQFNFIDSGGIGVHYFFNTDIAFTLEGRFRHLSNASIRHPNNGIDSYVALVGISRLF